MIRNWHCASFYFLSIELLMIFWYIQVDENEMKTSHIKEERA